MHTRALKGCTHTVRAKAGTRVTRKVRGEKYLYRSEQEKYRMVYLSSNINKESDTGGQRRINSRGRERKGEREPEGERGGVIQPLPLHPTVPRTLT